MEEKPGQSMPKGDTNSALALDELRNTTECGRSESLVMRNLEKLQCTLKSCLKDPSGRQRLVWTF